MSNKKTITSEKLRESYLEFFEKRGHTRIGSSSLIPVNDASVLFTTAGMQPLVPYLLGEKHPAGKRLCNVQKCVRLGDIDSVGDDTHCTFFEMLGHWSLGDYFKETAIQNTFDFFTTVLEIKKEELAVTVFKGDKDAPFDQEAFDKWIQLGIKKDRIFKLEKEHNWWGAGESGPCGPDTEIFLVKDVKVNKKEDSPAYDTGKYVELGNNVFMEYFKDNKGNYTKLKQKNVDTGIGLERILCTLTGSVSVYETDLFKDAILFIKKNIKKKNLEQKQEQKAVRIIADHIRTATFIMGDEMGVVPSNVDRGYVVRRLIRRAIRYAKLLELEQNKLIDISSIFIKKYQKIYPELQKNEKFIKKELKKEIEKFEKTLANGLKEMEKVLKYAQNSVLNGKTAFRLYDTYGFPLEMTIEIAKEKGFDVDIKGYKEAEKKHHEKSKQGAKQKFKGGIANNTEKTANLHTATHLLLAALKNVLGEHVNQRGSNITEERLRFDFNFERAMTKEEITAVENFVNDAIRRDLKVECKEMDIKEAEKIGATGIFKSKYGDAVKVYKIGDVSLEICGGPHAKKTSDLGTFKIKKEQSSSAGVRRIRAILE